jgi:2-octaprenyl-3-methyl-6-methoxy-1,4-benzoquinol hydroxylase
VYKTDENQERTQFDIIVVGGGMVGAAAACLLAKQGLHIAVVEQAEPEAYSPAQAMDLRVSAISPASVALLQQAGVWDAILAMRMRAYNELATWEISGLETHFHAHEAGVNELGYIIENRLIQLALWQQLQAFPNVSLYCPAQINALIQTDEQAKITLNDGQMLSASWLLAADGANSKLRALAKIGMNSWDYRQDCLLINVDLADDAPAITWQQFYPSGPRSFLPLAGNKASLVWYDSPARIAQLTALTPTMLDREVKRHFPEQLPACKVTHFGSFPLTRRHAQHYYQGRVILLGDAAHTIHPLAGQGVNLGFKDVACLVDLWLAVQQHQDFGLKQLQRYERQRLRDNTVMQSTMDLFYAGFSSSHMPLKVLRNVALLAAENAGWLKQKALRYALGL